MAVDGRRGWLVAGACCLLNAVFFGMARLSGVLFVASGPRFRVDRERAAFPYTLATVVRNASGPLVGYLGHRLGVRPVTAFGCLLGSAGIGACFFAEDIAKVTVLWGAVFGLGFGLGNILLPVSINQHFDRLRATASGISYSGACVGSLVLPPAVELLLDSYGLSGTFLFLSGLVLSCLPAALLLREPDPPAPGDDEERRRITGGRKVKMYTVEDVQQEKAPGGHPAALTYAERVKRLSTQTLLSDYSIRMSCSEPADFEEVIRNSKGRRRVDPAVFEAEVSSATSQLTDEDDVFARDSDCASTNTGSMTQEPRRADVSPVPTASKPGRVQSHRNMAYETDLDENGKNQRSADQKSADQKSADQKSADRKSADQRSADQRSADLCCSSSVSFAPSSEADATKTASGSGSALGPFSVLLDPMFLLIVVTDALYSSTFICMITVIVDFARDLGVGRSNEKYVLMSLSAGDLAGRLGLGLVTDRGHMTLTRFACLCFACQAVAAAAVAWCGGFAPLMAVIALYGLSEAGLILIFPLLVAQFIEEEKQTVAIPSSKFLAGPLCLAVAPLIGYFRDQVGAYDYIFYGIGAVSALSGLAWGLAPLLASGRRRTSGPA